MKKIIYVAFAIASAVMMVACGGNTTKMVTKGSKSKMDSLSHAVGMSVSYGTTYNMPDVRLDWDEVMKGAEEGLKVATDVKEDPKHQEYYATLEEFFVHQRQDRLREMQIVAQAEDSTATFNPKEVDIFENNEERKKISYAYGYDFGFNVRLSRLPLQTYWIGEGMKAGAAEDAAMAFQYAQDYMRRYYTEILPEQNKEKSVAWLAKVEKQKGVQKTESGLLYRIDREGDANVMPKAEDTVKVDYEGKLSDGSVFDSSYERGQSIEFPLNQVIKGWTEGLQLVGKGGQITLWIPAELGYGAHGAGGNIGPNEALEFKVELHDVIVAEPAVEETTEETTEE